MQLRITNDRGLFAKLSLAAICPVEVIERLERFQRECPTDPSASDWAWALEGLHRLLPCGLPATGQLGFCLSSTERMPTLTPCLGFVLASTTFVNTAHRLNLPHVNEATPDTLGWEGLVHLLQDPHRWAKVVAELRPYGLSRYCADLRARDFHQRCTRFVADQHARWALSADTPKSLMASDVVLLYSPEHKGYVSSDGQFSDVASARPYASEAAARRSRYNSNHLQRCVLVLAQVRIQALIPEPGISDQEGLDEFHEALAHRTADRLTTAMTDTDTASPNTPSSRRPRL